MIRVFRLEVETDLGFTEMGAVIKYALIAQLTGLTGENGERIKVEELACEEE